MVGVDDIDSYARQNDIGPDDPAPRAPEGDPSQVTDQFEIWTFEAEASETIPDVFVVARDPSPLDFRMWVFAGTGPNARFIMRASHRYGAEEPVPDDEVCCEVLMDGQSLAPIHCPDEVEAVVAELTETDVMLPTEPDDDHGGPVRY